MAHLIKINNNFLIFVTTKNYKVSKATFIKVVKRIAIVFTSIVVLLVISILSIPYIFENEVNSKVKSLVNEHITGELNYSKVRLTFFDQFPLLTASMDDVLLKGAEPFKNDTLLAAKKVSFGVDLMSLLKSKIVIDKFIVNSGKINILVDSMGNANYSIYKSTPSDSTKTQDNAESSALAFQLIKLEKTNLHYEDRSIPLQIEAKDLEYEGKGDLMSNIFDLNTRAKIESFSFSFDNELYVDKKSIDANLLTRINTNTLSFVFERNDIKINQLPVRFRGLLSFISHGYHLDFKLKSQESTLAELLSLVPNSYASWIKDLSVKGTSEVFVNLAGDYIVDNNKMPNLSLGLMVNNGFLAYKQSTNPLTDWNAKLRIDLPALNPDSLQIDLKQFDFKVASGYFSAQGNIAGLHPVTVHANIKSDLNLDKLHASLQFPDFSFGGKWNLDAKIDGTYAKAVRKVGLQKREQEYVASIPTFDIKNTLVDGKFKLAKLPQGLDKIAYRLEAKDPDGQLKSASIAIHDISVQALNNYIKGFISITDFNKIAVNSDLKASFNLADIKNFYPIKQVELAGLVDVNLIAKGYVDLKRNIFPETNTSIVMKNGLIKSNDYPIPMENIQVEAFVNSEKGSLRDLNVKILPVSFTFAGEPFFLNADLKNFNNIKYNIQSKGKLNLGPIYKLFALDGTNVDGFIYTDFSLKGLQSDATNGHYNRLQNSGRLSIGNIQVQSDMLPQPIAIRSGNFSFNQEKMNFDKFLVAYAKNDISIKGYLNNIINYATSSQAPLKGQFTLSSKKINVDDFMVFASPSSSTTASSSESGVVLLPKNLDVQVLGLVNAISYNKMNIKDFKGDLQVKEGKMTLNKTNFELAGLKVDMNGSYRPINPRRASFDYAVKADSFDIQRAYKEIPMFKEMVSSAKNAYGLVSLDYKLGGLLNGNMQPIMPSIVGEGSLTLNQIKFRGFKLLNGISQSTSKEKLKDGEVKKVVIKSHIKNNVMTIERTKMKMMGFRPRFEGQVTLDGRMNLGFRLGLPPFGIFGIPMRITGTPDNFHLKMGKYKEEDLDMDMDDEDSKVYKESQKVQETQTK